MTYFTGGMPPPPDPLLNPMRVEEPLVSISINQTGTQKVVKLAKREIETRALAFFAASEID